MSATIHILNPASFQQALTIGGLTTIHLTDSDLLVCIAAIGLCGSREFSPTFATIPRMDAERLVCVLTALTTIPDIYEVPESVIWTACDIRDRIALEHRLRTIDPHTACRELREYLSSFDLSICREGENFTVYAALLTELEAAFSAPALVLQ